LTLNHGLSAVNMILLFNFIHYCHFWYFVDAYFSSALIDVVSLLHFSCLPHFRFHPSRPSKLNGISHQSCRDCRVGLLRRIWHQQLACLYWRIFKVSFVANYEQLLS